MDKFIKIGIIILLLLVVISDIKTKEISNKIMIILTVFGLMYGINLKGIEVAIKDGGLYTLPFLMIYGYLSDFLEKECIGFADIKLSFVLGLISKQDKFLDVMIFLNLVFILALVFIIFFYIQRKKLLREIALTPFMILSFIFINGAI